MKNYLVIEITDTEAARISEEIANFPNARPEDVVVSVNVIGSPKSITVTGVKNLTMADPARVQFDPYTLMAAGMYKVKPKDVTDAMRVNAKVQACRAETAYSKKNRISVTEININHTEET